MNTYNHLDTVLGIAESNIPYPEFNTLLETCADPYIRTADPWNKGKTNVYSDDTLKSMSDSAKGNTRRRGRVMSEESKQKMREAKLKNPVRYWAGRTIPQEAREKMSVAARNRKKKSVVSE